ncbi:MAG: DUF6206 family protein [Candidatus Binatia bacterium]|nr:DUF6206 family protein [Candidatus Binatia bacterium]
MAEPPPALVGLHDLREVLDCAGAKRRQAARLLGPRVLRDIARCREVAGPALLRISPLGHPFFEGRWTALEDARAPWPWASLEALRAQCRTWITSEAGARHLAEETLEPARLAGLRQRHFLVERRECLADPTDARCLALAAAAEAFASDVEREARLLASAFREIGLRASARLRLASFGAGEVSRILALRREQNGLEPPSMLEDSVYKRVCSFDDPADARVYVETYDEYQERLEEAGIQRPRSKAHILGGPGSTRTILVSQERVPAASLAPARMARADDSEAIDLFGRMLEEIGKARRYSRKWRGGDLGIDSHIGNWAVCGDGRGAPGPGLLFLDTQAPMMKVGGEFRMPISMHAHLGGIPRGIRTLAYPFTRSVIGRYFKPRLMVLDSVAYVAIYGRPDLMDALLPVANEVIGSQGWGRALGRRSIDLYLLREMALFRGLRTARLLSSAAGREARRELLADLRRVWTSPLYRSDGAVTFKPASDRG